MSNEEWKDVYDGLILRALICKRCKTVLPVAVDEPEAMKGMKAVHHRKNEYGYAHHEVVRANGDKMTVWKIDDSGTLSSIIESGAIVRIASAKKESTR